MSFNKIHVSGKATTYFPMLKGRTGLTPNILCRMALCLSVADPSIPNPKLEDEKGQEFSRYTLLGEWDSFFISILRERLIHDGLDDIYDLISTDSVYGKKQEEEPDSKKQKKKKNRHTSVVMKEL